MCKTILAIIGALVIAAALLPLLLVALAMLVIA